MVRDLLAKDGTFEFECAPMADAAAVELAHDPLYVQHFLAGTLTPQAIRRIGFPWSEGLVKRTLASVGGTQGATLDALAHGWGGNLAGGTHHAFRGEGSGFCVFNDIAIAIQWLRAQGRIQRAAIVDLDVHQGDGTAQIFENDPDVFTVSLHCKSNFPFRKQRSKLDVDLPDRMGDEEYLRILDRVVPAVFAFEPEIVYYQSGVDGLASDTLGKLSLTTEGLRERDRHVMEAVRAHRLPLVVTLGGGYSLPVELTAQAHANTFVLGRKIFGDGQTVPF